MPKKAQRGDVDESFTFSQGMKRVPIDAKSRITIPRLWRSIFEDKDRGDHMLCLVADRCRIDVLPQKLYQEKQLRISRNNSMYLEDIKAKRAMQARTEKKGLDAEGRLTLSKRMQTMTHISSRAVLIWMEDWLEIWSEVEFDAWEKTAPTMDELEARVSVPIKSDEIPEKATALGQNQQDAGEAEQ
ncbi:hypothetical protein J7M28_03570 [bacterium]|nr:hypothetical protein [bacterium]